MPFAGLTGGFREAARALVSRPLVYDPLTNWSAFERSGCNRDPVVQRAIGQGLGQVRPAYPLGAIEVGDGAGYLQNPQLSPWGM